MSRRVSFSGFDELIRRPLAAGDPHSYTRILQALTKTTQPHSAPFAFLLTRLTGRKFSPDEARIHWERIIALKSSMEKRLGWVVDIQTAAVEYFSLNERSAVAASQTTSVDHTMLLSRNVSPDSPDYPLARLREELQRSRRYNHALSVLLLDAAATLNDCETDVQNTCMKSIASVVERTVRSVDILIPCGSTQLLVILPDTNRREAQELAERIRQTVLARTGRINQFKVPVDLRVAVEQAPDDMTAGAFLKTLQSAVTQQTQ